MLSADGLSFTPGEYDASLIRTSPVAPSIPQSVFVGDEDLGVLTGDVAFPFVPYEDTFLLHSNPTAPHTIYLDFDGHRTTNTAWNAGLEDPLTGQDINSPPYDTDGDFGSFSDEELNAIQDAFLRVSEDFAPFNVNVTTQEPADLDDLRRNGEFDERWGIRVVSGGSSNDWLTPGEDEDPAGGVAFLFSFNDPIDTPTFAFSEGFNAGDPALNGKFLAEVISHEVGHTLGLSHDGLLAQPGWDPDDPEDPRAPVEYYPGQGDWAPIMGVAYLAPVSQFSQGEYFMASNDQDDLAIIAGPTNGVGYRIDDQQGAFFGNGVIGATQLDREPPTIESIFANSIVYKQEGIIEQNTDTDYYEFFSNQGTITVDALPAAVGANLDIKIELLDSSGNVLAVGAPDNDLTATLEATAFVPGFYTVAITGDASQAVPQPVSPASTDYSDYGSVGQYALTISAALGPLPDAYEKNDFLSTAYDAPYADYTFRGSVHQGGDEDYYRWKAGETGTLKADLRFLHAEGDLELEIYNQAGDRIPGAVSASNTDNEFLEIDVVANQYYTVRVWAPGTATQDSYELWLDGPGVPLDGFTSLDGTIDLASQFASFEFDDPALKSELGPVEKNDAPENAFVLKPGPSSGGSSESDYDLDLSIHRPDDNDYLLWTSPGTGKLILDVGFDHSQANIDVEVRRANLDADGVPVSSVGLTDGLSESTDDNEQVIVDVTAGTAYLIHVYATATPGTAAPGDALYSLKIDGPEINFDPYELNNTLLAASNSLNGQVGITTGLSIHSDIDTDYFRWTAPATGDLRARAFFFHENGDLDLNLLDENGDVVAVSTSLNDNESVTERVIAGRDYFVKVYGFDGATQPSYALDLAFAPAPEIPGDFDGNGFVDIFDRTIWHDTYGATPATLPEGETELRADANEDGIVDEVDYTVWRDNQGSGRVPELASVIAAAGKAPGASTYVGTPAAASGSSAAVVAESPVAPADSETGSQIEMATALVPLSETFTLHSNPDSNYTIYLDFNGHLTHNEDVGIETGNPYWNGVLNPLDEEGNPLLPDGRFGLPFFSPAYTIDEDTSANFSDAELLNIQEAFARVAEDFAPFDVNVTTEEPPLGDLKDIGGDDTRWGIRLVVGGSTFDWYTRTADPPLNGEAGGVALLGSFRSDLDTPAYAFEEGFGTSAKNLAEVISHEIGHTLGLAHDGQFTDPTNVPIDPENPPVDPPFDEYFGGHDNGFWGPIMGAAYTPTVSQWSNGGYFFANNPEDDLDIIAGPTATNGFGFRADDHGDSDTEATFLAPNYAAQSFEGSGLIGTNTDFDFFALTTGAGAIDITALPVEFGPNLDIRLELLNEALEVVAIGAPDFELSASLSYVAPTAGVYYLSVTGDAHAADASLEQRLLEGYDDYGSLGEYTFTISAALGIEADRFEENNSFETAADLGTDDQDLTDLSRHTANDVDVFLWTANHTGDLTVDLLFQHAESDLDLEVFDAATQVLIAPSYSSTNNESVTISAVSGKTYAIRVAAFEPATTEDYTLRIDGPADPSDRYESNNTPEDAATLLGSDVSEPLSLHFAGDEDYFSWQAAADDQLSVGIEFDDTQVDMRVELLNSETNEVLIESSPVASGEAFVFDVTQGETYLVRVYSDAAVDSRKVGDYRLLLNGPALTGDRLEPNGPSNPTVLTSGRVKLENLSIHTGSDIDSFTYVPPTTGTLRVSALFAHRFGDIDISLVGPQGLLAETTSATDNEFVFERVVGGQTYTINVYGYQGAIVSDYTLETLYTVAPLFQGDFNYDGIVSDIDRTIWATTYGKTDGNLFADANSDGVVDAADYTVFRDNAGNSQPPIAEPSATSNPSRAERSAGYTPAVRHAIETIAEESRIDSINPVFANRPVGPLSDRSVVSGVGRVAAVTPDLTAQASDDALLLFRDPGVSAEEESLEPLGPHEDASRDDASRDDAFAELAVAFDRLG